MNEDTIVTQNGEVTELTKPEDFGKGMAFVNPAEMPDLEQAEVGFNIQPEYHEFVNVGDTLRAVYNGISSIKTKDKQNPGEYKDIEAVVLQNKDGIKLNAGASLVSQFKHLAPGAAVQITYKGTEKTKGGNNVKTFEVRLLNVPRVNVPKTYELPHKAEEHKPQFKNAFLSTEYWTKATELRFTREEGLAHLAESNNDFEEALAKLTGI